MSPTIHPTTVARRGGPRVSRQCYTTQDGGECLLEVAPTTKAAFNSRHVHRVSNSVERTTLELSPTDKTVSYTDNLNSWVNSNSVYYDSGRYHKYGQGKYSQWSFERQIQTPTRLLKASAYGTQLHELKNLVSQVLLINLSQPIVGEVSKESDQIQTNGVKLQMESELKENEQGLTIQASDKESNTIVTRDEGRSETTVTARNDCVNYASSEPYGQFELLTKRWMPLDQIRISTDQTMGTLVEAYYLPETLYSLISKSANLVPFQTFIYAEMDITMKFVVNANRFQCGKVLASAKFDSYQCDELQSSVFASLHRPHVILDLASNNEGDLHVPFRYHRALVRLSSIDSVNRGVRPKKYASVYVHILSQLRTGTNNATDMFIRPFVKIENIKFCGMSYRVDLQMESILPVLGTAVGSSGALKKLLSGAESLLKDTDSTPNRDKPSDIRSTIVVPKARMNFGTGKGPTDSQPLRVDPTSSTAYTCIQPYEDDPKTTLDIAQIWGLRSTFEWAATVDEGTAIYTLPIDPSSRQYINNYIGNPTPLEYASSLYNFWSGTIELRFDFVSNAFHTGAVQISVEFGRPTGNTDTESLSASTYTKTFHLGEQKSCHMTVPYIYDTVWRRSNTLPYNPYQITGDRSQTERRNNTAIYAQSRTRVTVRVINQLRPTSTAPQTIDVLVYWRASPSYRLHSLKQSSFSYARECLQRSSIMDNFPAEYSNQARRKRAVDNNGPAGQENQYGEADPKNISQGAPMNGEDLDDQHALPEEGVNYQMDSGAKEDQDSTADFRVGLPALPVQTNDSQTNIKDILRRPVLMMTNRTVLAYGDTNTAFFIPLMPPSRNMSRIYNANDTTQDNFWCPLAPLTPQGQLMSLFRFWRGSMRYTIVVESANHTQPIYVTHIPHTGVRIIGNHTISPGAPQATNIGQVADGPLHASGLTVDMLIPQVNPTLQIETPFDTENSWCLTFEENPSRNYTWRDKGDTNVGHLALTSLVDVNVSVWWSAGDDFEVGNFYGIPQCITTDATEALSDINYQMEGDEIPVPPEFSDMVPEDFHDADEFVPGYLVNKFQQLRCIIKDNSDYLKYGAAAAISQVPVVGPTLLAVKASTLAVKVDRAASAITDMSTAASNTLHNLLPTIDNMDNLITYLHAQLRLAMENVFRITHFCASYKSILEDLLFDLAAALATQSWQVAATSVVRLFLKVVGVGQAITSLSAVIPKLTSWFSSFFSPHAHLQGPSNESTLIGLLAGLIGAAYGVHIDPKYYNTFGSKLVHCLTDVRSVSYVNSVIRLFQCIFDILRDMVMHILGYINPETRALQMFSSNSPLIEKFVLDAQMITSEVNANQLFNPAYRTKFWLTVLQAQQIQSILCRLPTNAASPTLSRLCSDVVKCANEKSIDLTSCPVRFVPFTFHIAGSPGIGKSFLNNTLCARLLRKVNFTRPTAGIVYNRPPGNKYWPGYRDQPVVTYDDIFNLNDSESITQIVGEIYAAVSTSDFIPPMAELNEKKIKGNPLIISSLGNTDFPNHVSNVVVCMEALNRRRNILVKARLRQGWTHAMIKTLTPEQSESMAHLEFQIHHDPRNKNAGYRPETLDWSQFVEFMETEFEAYYNREILHVSRRLRELQEQMSSIPLEEIALEDPFKFFSAAQYTMPTEPSPYGWVPSQRLEVSVREVAAKIDQAFDERNARLNGVTLQGPTPHAPPDIRENVYPIATCGACSSVTLCSLRCTSNETPHFYCNTCVQTLDLKNNCLYCSNSTLNVALSPNGYSLLVWLKNVVTAAGDEWNAVRNLIADSTLFERTKFIVNIQILEFITSRLLAARASTSCLAGAGIQYFFWVCDRDPVHSKFGLPDVCTQASLSDEPTVVDQQELLFRMRTPEPVMSRFPAFLALGKPQQTCAHSIVYANLTDTSTTYRTFEGVGRWRTLVIDPNNDEEFWVECDDVPCTNVAECMLATEEDAHHFYQRYAGSHSRLLRQSLLNYYLLPDKSVHRAGVPYMLRPKWMDVEPTSFTLKGNWWEYLSEKFDKYKQLIIIFGTATTVLASVYGAMRLMNSCPTSVLPTEQSDYGHDGARHLKRVMRNVKIRGEKRPNTSIRLQGEDQTLAARELVRNNYISIRTWENGKPLRCLGAVGVVGKVAILPKHYYKYLKANAECKNREITVERSVFIQESALCPPNHTRHVYTFDDADFGVHPTTDLAFFTLPPSFPSFRDIRKHFATDKDLNTYLPNTGLIEAVPTTRRKFIDAQRVNLLDLQTEVKIAAPQDLGDDVVRDVISYTFSEDGACGSVLIADRSTRPLLSIHTAGTRNKVGYGTIITQELLKEFLPEQIILQMEEVELDPVYARDDAFLIDPDAKIEYLGVVAKNQEHFTPKKSKIRPSLLNNIPPLESHTEPTILHAGDKRYKHVMSPLYYGCSKHGIRSRDFGTSLVERAASAYWNGWLSGMRPAVLKPKVLTPKEAVMGFPGVEFYDMMKLTTSAGYPWTVWNKSTTTKEAWIEAKRDEQGNVLDVTIDSRVLEEMDRKRSLRRQGIQPVTIFADTLKDERKKSEKVLKEGGTRVFCGSPIDYTIEVRRQILHFCAAFMKARFEVFNAVGINAKGSEWSDLFHYLTKTGANKFVTLDYSNFGPALNAQVAKAAAKLIVRWAKDNIEGIDEKELEILLMECVNSVHIANNLVYQQFSGSPSGAPTTSIFNSLVNLLYIFIAWIELCGQNISETDIWAEFRRCVRFAVYGDDLIMSVTDDYIAKFNINTIKDFFAKHEIVATSADKELQRGPDWVPLSVATFLKRGFIPHPFRDGQWLSPLDWISVVDATQWIWSCADHRAATLENCMSALHEAHGHGPDAFEQLRTDINKALTRMGLKRELITLEWSALDNLYFPEYDVTEISYQMESDPLSIVETLRKKAYKEWILFMVRTKIWNDVGVDEIVNQHAPFEDIYGFEIHIPPACDDYEAEQFLEQELLHILWRIDEKYVYPPTPPRYTLFFNNHYDDEQLRTRADHRDPSDASESDNEENVIPLLCWLLEDFDDELVTPPNSPQNSEESDLPKTI